MVINISVQYNGGLLPDIILLTQGYYHWGTRSNTMWWLCIYSLLCSSILLLPCVMMYYMVSGLFYCFFVVPAWRLMQMYSITVGLSPTLYC